MHSFSVYSALCVDINDSNNTSGDEAEHFFCFLFFPAGKQDYLEGIINFSQV